VWTHREKQAELQQHFQNILRTRSPRGASINWEELSLPQLMTEKAPGLDGFTEMFYRSCWEVIKPELLAAFQCFYNQTAGPLPRLNGALLALLSKKYVFELPGYFRPISLIHSFAKLISKVLA
jgi:hypothetical protein